MEYYSLEEYILSIVVATFAAFIGISLIKRMKFIEPGKMKVHFVSILFGAAIYFSYLFSNISDIKADITFFLGVSLLLYSTFAVNSTINTICYKEISFFRLIVGSIIFSSCISLVNMVDIRSEMMAHDLKMNLFLFISANILLIGNTLATIRFIRQLRHVEKVSIYWILFGSFAIGMAFSSIRFTLFSSITLFSNIDLFTNDDIPIQGWVYLNKTLLPLTINIFGLVFLELVPGLFSDFYSKKQEELIIENKRRYETLFDNQAVAIFSLNNQGELIDINSTVTDITGFRLEDFQRTKMFNGLIYPSKEKEFTFCLEEALLGKSQMLETKMLTASKQYIDVQITIIPIFVKGNLSTINLLAKDITEVIQTREQVQYLAYHDPLTQLPNRRFFTEELQGNLSEPRVGRMAVCFLDVDRFKVINDILGHQTGDDLLRMLSQRFLNCMDEKTIVARMGGDEFTFLIPNVHSLTELENKMEELIKTIQKPFQIEDQELYVTGSIGVALYPTDATSSEDLMKFADAAMYRAKDKGKNTFEFYHTQANEKSVDRLLLEKDLRKAIVEGQMEIYYQPQVNARTGKIFSMEALLRWNHPEKGILSPNDFIPIAEENGVIHELGEWVLFHSCMQLKSWHSKGFKDLQLSVNISFKQFYNKHFVSTVKTILDQTEFEPHLLDLEITESMAMKDLDYAVHIFEQLKKLGVSISIDDFGTGYSSLNHIKNFPINRVKIDGSFVRDLPNNQEAVIIIKTIIAMAKNLNLVSIAEHVETDDQYEFLKSIECEEIQGFHFSPPLSVNHMDEYLESQKQKGENFVSTR
ncbi:EAL domain-containing protein [Bacillus timonensis]|nr:EAL domain-containing protein [Bacillus timonensis]